jgi:hypothetical protein
MPFNRDLLGVMNYTFQWFAFTGEDLNGNPTYKQQPVAVAGVAINNTSRGAGGDQTDTSGPVKSRSFTIVSEPNTYQPRDKFVLNDGTQTFVDNVVIYQDPIYGDPALAELDCKELQ